MTSILVIFLRPSIYKTLRIPSSVLFHAACFAQRSNLDFTNAYTDPDSGALCIKQEVCIPNLEALAKNLPAGPCIPSDEGCNCLSDGDCQLNGGSTARYAKPAINLKKKVQNVEFTFVDCNISSIFA